MDEAALLSEQIEQFNRTANRLRQAYARLEEKFDCLHGNLAAKIAHEIRNPLGSIELFASLLMKDLKEKKDRERVAQIISAVKSMENAVSDLLLAANGAGCSAMEVNVHDILREILLDSRQMADGRGLFLRTLYAEREPFIAGEALMLKQVLLNLVLNALQTIRSGGCLLIETRCLDEKDRRCGGRPSVEIRFTEDGDGNGGESRSRMFGPFFDTEERGSGLGLAIVNSIVRCYRGSVHIEMGEGGDTVFSIVLPLVDGGERDIPG